MNKPEKVIFLDIDGPMIPNTSILFDRDASWCQHLDKRCVKVLHRILKDSGAKIVFNTTHNRMLTRMGEPEDELYTPGLRRRFVDAGFGDHIHERDHTSYPDVSRYDAIMKWVEDGGYGVNELLWVAFDDVKIDHKRAYLTDVDLGIGLREYNHAAQYLMFKPFIVL